VDKNLDDYMAACAIVQRIETTKDPKPKMNARSFLYAAYLVATEEELGELMQNFPGETLLVESAAKQLILNTRKRGNLNH